MLRTNLPNSLTISGKVYPIDTDFRRWIRFSQVLEADDLTETERVQIVLFNTFGGLTHDPPEALAQSLWFYRRGQEPRGNPDLPKERLLDWDKDWMTIWADMRIWCRVNLRCQKHLHWWEFMALFQSLPSDAAIKQTMQLRSTDLSGIKDPDMRRDYAKRKELVYLGEVKTDKFDPFGY